MARYLPKDREYTELEANYSLQLNYDKDSEVTVAGLAKAWNWKSRGKVYRFLDSVGVEIVYPKKMEKKRNKRGKLVFQKRTYDEQITDKGRTNNGHIRLINNRWLDYETDIERAYGGHKTGIGCSTINHTTYSYSYSYKDKEPKSDIYKDSLNNSDSELSGNDNLPYSYITDSEHYDFGELNGRVIGNAKAGSSSNRAHDMGSVDTDRPCGLSDIGHGGKDGSSETPSEENRGEVKDDNDSDFPNHTFGISYSATIGSAPSGDEVGSKSGRCFATGNGGNAKVVTNEDLEAPKKVEDEPPPKPKKPKKKKNGIVLDLTKVDPKFEESVLNEFFTFRRERGKPVDTQYKLNILCNAATRTAKALKCDPNHTLLFACRAAGTNGWLVPKLDFFTGNEQDFWSFCSSLKRNITQKSNMINCKECAGKSNCDMISDVPIAACGLFDRIMEDQTI
jgi:hypothetical protein